MSELIIIMFIAMVLFFFSELTSALTDTEEDVIPKCSKHRWAVNDETGKLYCLTCYKKAGEENE